MTKLARFASLILVMGLAFVLMLTPAFATTVADIDYETGDFSPFTSVDTGGDPTSSITVTSTSPINGTYSQLSHTECNPGPFPSCGSGDDDAKALCTAGSCGSWASAASTVYVKYAFTIAADLESSHLGIGWIETSNGLIVALDPGGTNTIEYWNGGGWADTSATTVAANTEYCLEFMADGPGDSIEIRLDESSIATNSQTIPDSIDEVAIGRDWNNGAMDIRIDDVVISDSDWPGCGGAEPTPTPTPTPPDEGDYWFYVTKAINREDA